MAKPHSQMTLPQLKEYIRTHKLNKPEVRLGMKKADMVAGLKKIGHWDYSKDKNRPKPAPKKAPPKKEPKYPHDKGKGTIGKALPQKRVSTGPLMKGKVLKPKKEKKPAPKPSGKSIDIDFDREDDNKGYWFGTLKGQWKGKNKIVVKDYGGVLTKGYHETRKKTFGAEETKGDRSPEDAVISRLTPKQRAIRGLGDNPDQFYFGTGSDYKYAKLFYLKGGKLIEFDKKHGDMKTGGQRRPKGWRQGGKYGIPRTMEEIGSYYKKHGKFEKQEEGHSYEALAF
jgi:hypothetical protein